jgi:hypothetical protein
MGNGQWAMGNGQWAMGNGQWAINNGQKIIPIGYNKYILKTSCINTDDRPLRRSVHL